MRTGRHTLPGFSLIELLTAITIVAILISLIAVGINSALSFAKVSGEQQAAASIKLGVEQFKQEFGFLPPLVLHDEKKTVSSTEIFPARFFSNNDIVPNTLGGRVSSSFNNAMFLEGFFGPVGSVKGMTSDSRLGSSSARIAEKYVADRRFSEYSLAYYLTGALPASMDGVDGPGMNPPQSDGSFSVTKDSKSTRVSSAVRVYEPMIDVSRGRPKLDVQVVQSPGFGEPQFPVRYRLLAPNGLPYRYYRWEPRKYGPNTALNPQPFDKWDFYDIKEFAPEDDVDRLNIPSILGNPRENAELRSASYAIVSAGPNQFFGDMPLEAATDAEFGDMQAKLGVPSGNQYNARTREAARKDNVVEVGR